MEQVLRRSYYRGMPYAPMTISIGPFRKRRCSSKDAFLDSVLPGHKHGHGPDSGCTTQHQESKQAEPDPDSDSELMQVPDLSSTDQTSPCSPSNSDSDSDSSISTCLTWKDEDFKLKDEDSC